MEDTPAWLSTAFDEFYNCPLMGKYFTVADPGLDYKFDDSLLSKVIAAELYAHSEEANELMNCNDTLESGQARDLLMPMYSARTFRARYGHSLGESRSYLRATSGKSQFRFWGDGTAFLKVSATTRLPFGLSVRHISILLNGLKVVTFLGGNSWEKREFFLRDQQLQGLNCVEIIWPHEGVGPDINLAVEMLQRGRIPDLLPTFGELYTFTVERLKEA
jgi:hypothetical protein